MATLKRIMLYLNKTLECETQVRAAQGLPAARLDRFRNDLFDLRDGILELMTRFGRNAI